MRKLARKRVLEFGGIVSLVALLALTGFQFPVEHAPVDWRKTTVEGFPAGVTAQQLEGELGSPVIRDGEAVWKENLKFEVRFRQSRDGFHLTGKRLLLDRQVLAENSESPFYLIGAQPALEPTKYITPSDIRAMLGRGESVKVRDDNREFGDPAEYETTIRYREQPDGPNELLVNRVLWPKASDRIESFELVWNVHQTQEPVIAGYSGGPNGYSIYPNQNGDFFFSHDLARDGKVILEYASSQDQIRRALGPPDARSEDDCWWGYWTKNLPERKMGILIRGGYKGQLAGVEVSRDYRILAEHLAQHNADSHPAESSLLK